MNDKLRCQSCGMPVGPGFYGTNKDSSENHEFCKFCFKQGRFTEPDITMDTMIARAIDNMINELHLSKEKANEFAYMVIPKLNRWYVRHAS